MKGVALMATIAFAVAAGCGAAGKRAASTGALSAGTTTPRTSTTVTATSASAEPALQPEAAGAAAGDIPDNQVFLVFRDAPAGFSMKYPEGWAQRGTGRRVTFRDKNNIVRIVIRRSGTPTRASVRADAATLAGATVTTAPQQTVVSGRPAFKLRYHTTSPPNPVTGKRVELVVDRYYLWDAGRLAIVDLGTPVGVDNVDAYRLMIESLRWS